jgi:hypothetical protein
MSSCSRPAAAEAETVALEGGMAAAGMVTVAEAMGRGVGVRGRAAGARGRAAGARGRAAGAKAAVEARAAARAKVAAVRVAARRKALPTEVRSQCSRCRTHIP